MLAYGSRRTFFALAGRLVEPTSRSSLSSSWFQPNFIPARAGTASVLAEMIRIVSDSLVRLR